MAASPSPYPPPGHTRSATGNERMAGLPPEAVARMHAAARAIRDGAVGQAMQSLEQVLATAPEHPEALRLLGILQRRLQRPTAACDALQRALAQWPDDAQIHGDLAGALLAGGDRTRAVAHWRRACELEPGQAMPWFNLGRNLQQLGSSEAAADALAKACALAPEFLPAKILLGDALVHLGRFDEAIAGYRAALALQPACGDAWRGLANVKTRPLGDDDREAIESQLRRPGIDETDRIALGYALGKVEEDQQRYPQAFAALSAANALLRRRAPWNEQALADFVEAAIAASAALPAPLDPSLGEEIVFIVGLPRSGSTLLEQMLAAHPEVEGASELPELGEILQAESVRRGQRYPSWVAQASAGDWQRLGREYLERTAHWRRQRPRNTDKMPDNWKHVGVLRAMLPGASIIEMRRDPLEAGWSCFKQQFYQLPHFSCDLADIAAYIHHCERAMDLWRQRDPRRVQLQRYEALLADPETELRRLLAACGLAFDARCLQFHLAGRSVRTASAAQVRQPLRTDTARAAAYGGLLDPLREGLDARRVRIG